MSAQQGFNEANRPPCGSCLGMGSNLTGGCKECGRLGAYNIPSVWIDNRDDNLLTTSWEFSDNYPPTEYTSRGEEEPHKFRPNGTSRKCAECSRHIRDPIHNKQKTDYYPQSGKVYGR